MPATMVLVMDKQSENDMKYTSVIAAAAVLSASTFAGFNVGVGAGNLVFEGKRVIHENAMDTEIGGWATDDAFGHATAANNINMVQGTTEMGSHKNILDLRAGYSYDFSDMFTLDAGLVLSSGKLKSLQSNAMIAHEDDGSSNNAVALHERLIFNLKPTYGFDIKALFSMNGVKFGPEVRIQRFEQTNEGETVFSELDNGANPVANADDITATADDTKVKLKTDKKDLDETMFGVTMSAKLNERLTVSAGYLTVKAKQLKAEFESNITAVQVLPVYGLSAAGSEINLTTEKPHLELYYASVGMDF